MDELQKRWFKAAQRGEIELVSKLLAEQPNFITQSDEWGQNALHLAALCGHGKVVDMLLAARPTLIDAKGSGNRIPLHCAVSSGHVEIVARLLAARPRSIHAVTDTAKRTCLHLAAAGGHGKVMALLLAASPPELITQVDMWSQTALHEAANEEVFDQLLAACPQLIDARSSRDRTVLHDAAWSGKSELVTRILAVRPELMTAVDKQGDNALQLAVQRGHQKTAERILLNTNYGVLHAVSNIGTSGETVLHSAIEGRETGPFCMMPHGKAKAKARSFSKEFILKLWRMNPQALHVVSAKGFTPFDLVVGLKQRKNLVEEFQWSMSIDEIMGAFTKYNSRKSYNLVTMGQCDLLWDYLNQNVLSIVFEFIGLDPPKSRVKTKRAKVAKVARGTDEKGEENYPLRNRKVAKKN